VEVGDSGPGIEREHAARIFEPFYTTRAAGEGTGLGLGVALQVITACGGSIDVGRSRFGGALFSVRIPARQPPAGAAAALKEMESAT
jgi:signal transduction histidine kinase